MSRHLVIIGAGGFARETASAVHALHAQRADVRLHGFLDDDPILHGRYRGGVPVLGPLSMVDALPDASFLVCVGSPRDFGIRARLVARLGLPPERYATLVHPGASVGTGVRLGPGCVLLAGVVATADVTVGAHVAVMPQTVLTHDDIVEDYVTIASGVRLGGGAHIRTGAYLGAGALVRDRVTVGAGAMLGTGAVAIRDVPDGEVWVGNPARYLRQAAVAVAAAANGDMS